MPEQISLKEHFDEQIKAIKDFHNEREKRYHERFQAQEEAINVADQRLQEYKAQANEWRDQLRDVIETRVSSTAFSEFSKAMEDKVSTLQRLVYIGVGGIIVLEVIMKYIIK